MLIAAVGSPLFLHDWSGYAAATGHVLFIVDGVIAAAVYPW